MALKIANWLAVSEKFRENSPITLRKYLRGKIKKKKKSKKLIALSEIRNLILFFNSTSLRQHGF